MSIKKDEHGRRYVEAEAQIPGTPEEVWDAIASGPGVSSWFVPTREGADGTVVSEFGPGMEAIARKTAWDPPHRFAAESDGFGPDCPPIATEWIVETKGGDTCTVRVVHSLFTDKDDWDTHLEGIEAGWPDYFRLLFLYRTHFPGQYAQLAQSMAITPKPAADVWDNLTRALPLTGTLEHIGSAGHPHQRIIRTANALAHLFAMKMGAQTVVCLRVYDFSGGPVKPPEWQQWLQSQL